MFYTVAAVDHVVLLVLSVGMRNSATKMTQWEVGVIHIGVLLLTLSCSSDQ
jgi:hypothetical protein